MKISGPEYITIGRVLGSWGNKGKLKVKIITDFPGRFEPGSEVLIGREPVVIEDKDWRRGNLIIKIESLDSIEQARRHLGQPIEIHRSRLNLLPEGQYYLFQVIGLAVYSTRGDLLGRVAEVITTEGSDIYVVRGQCGEVLVPAIEDIVTSIDIDRGIITIEPVDGLLTLNDEKNDYSNGWKDAV
jgi:16S rRNA processing protein RimM